MLSSATAQHPENAGYRIHIDSSFNVVIHFARILICKIVQRPLPALFKEFVRRRVEPHRHFDILCELAARHPRRQARLLLAAR